MDAIPLYRFPSRGCTDFNYAAAIRFTQTHFIHKDGSAEKPGAASKDFKTAYIPFAPKPHEDLAEAVTHNLELETCVYPSFHHPLTRFGVCPIDIERMAAGLAESSAVLHRL